MSVLNSLTVSCEFFINKFEGEVKNVAFLDNLVEAEDKYDYVHKLLSRLLKQGNSLLHFKKSSIKTRTGIILGSC